MPLKVNSGRVKHYEEPRLSAAYALLGQISLSSAGLSRAKLTQEFERHLAHPITHN